MIEDKLDQDQRIRLECLAQANVLHGSFNSSIGLVIEAAKKMESFIKKGS